MMRKASILTAIGLVLLAAGTTLSVPYKVDSHTLHLYHFDGDTLDSATANPIDLTTDSGATVTDASYPGMGQALYTYEGTAPTNVNLPSAMASSEKAISNFVGADGAFTFEALVCPAFNLGSIPNNMQIISGEHNSARGWHFRVESAGNLVFTKLTGTVQDNMRTALPSSGPHAFAANKWFHAAVTYNGQADTDGNLKLYWTAIDSGVSEPALLGSFRMTADLTSTVAPNFVIGNEGRNNNGRTENWEGWIDEVRISDIARDPSEMVTEVLAGQATQPSPANEATDVPNDALLTWTASEFAAAHDVYFGTVLADVEAADRDNPMDILRFEGQPTTTYAPQGPLDYGRTYYWRIDEVNAASDDPVFKGDVWSFTVETYAYALDAASITATASSACEGMGPENTVNGSGLTPDGHHSTLETDMWLSVKDAPQPAWIRYEFDRVYKLDELLVWNYNAQAEGFIGNGVKDATIEYSADGETWTSLGDFQFAQAPGDETCEAQAIDLGGIVAKYVKLEIHSNWGGILAQYGLSEVQFLYVPTRAWDLKNEGKGSEVLLTWRAGREAAYHRIYVGTDQQAVVDGTAWVLTAQDNSLDLGTLQLGTTYYCRVDEVNEAAVPSVWEGDVWSFTTTEFLPIDDFEGYNDSDNCVFDTWKDGYIDKTSGSQVGYTDSIRGTFGETTIVHAGEQSMPFQYNNADTPYYSEAELEISPAQNWTSNGADTLGLWVQGDAANAPAEMYVTVQDKSKKTATATDSTLVTATEWTQWTIPFSSLTGVNTEAVAKLILGVDSRNAATKGTGTIYIDDIGFGHPAGE